MTGIFFSGIFGMESIFRHLKITGKALARKLACENIDCVVHQITITKDFQSFYDKCTSLVNVNFFNRSVLIHLLF